MSDTPLCVCGLERESAAHFLLHCNRFQEARNWLRHPKGDFRFIRMQKNGCLSEALLLALMSDIVTSKEEKFIKEALFEFISETRVKL